MGIEKNIAILGLAGAVQKVRRAAEEMGIDAREVGIDTERLDWIFERLAEGMSGELFAEPETNDGGKRGEVRVGG